jgi:hypothetical protein
MTVTISDHWCFFIFYISTSLRFHVAMVDRDGLFRQSLFRATPARDEEEYWPSQHAIIPPNPFL